ncbi:MAG TPA: TolC family protein [Polyangiaceae bacterium]
MAAGVVVLPIASGAAAQTLEVELTLRVCRSGPALMTARAERRLGLAEIHDIEPLQNPSLVLEHQQALSGPTDRETIVGAEVPLSISGRRGLLRTAAEARQRASNARADVDLLETALRFREAYVLAVIETERATIMQNHHRALAALSVALKQLNARGETAAYDVKRHEAEVRLHARALASAKARAQRAEKRLGRWLDGAIAPEMLSSKALVRRVEDSAEIFGAFGGPGTLAGEHPEVMALRSTARAAEIESDAARRRWVPEPEVFAGYRQVSNGEQTGHGVSLGLSLPLTFFEHGQGASTRARAERTLAEARADRLRREMDAELRAAQATLQPLEAALREAELNLGNTDQVKESARVLYGAGEVSITEILDAYRTGESAALDRLTALEDLLAARLAVMRAAGRQFEPELDASCGSRGKTTR